MLKAILLKPKYFHKYNLEKILKIKAGDFHQMWFMKTLLLSGIMRRLKVTIPLNLNPWTTWCCWFQNTPAASSSFCQTHEARAISTVLVETEDQRTLEDATVRIYVAFIQSLVKLKHWASVSLVFLGLWLASKLWPLRLVTNLLKRPTFAQTAVCVEDEQKPETLKDKVKKINKPFI